MSYLDLSPEAVGAAGRRTAATSSDWDAWADGARTLLREAATGARQPAVGAAFEDYLAGLSPVVQRLAALATRLGAGAAGAAGAIVDSDSEATRLLGQTGHGLGTHGSALRRPITG